MRRIQLARGRVCIYLHTSVVIFGAYMLVQGRGLLFAAGMLSILLHECAHALMAVACGYLPDSLDITPLGAMLAMHQEKHIPVPKRLLIIVAGPVASLLLCAASITFTKHGVLNSALGAQLMLCNAALLAINLLPCLPLDGGRLLSLALGLCLPDATVRKIMRISGCIIGTAMVLGAFALAVTEGCYNLSLVMIGLFLVQTACRATATEAYAALCACIERRVRLEQVGTARAEYIAAMADVPVASVVKQLHPSRFAQVIIIERGTQRTLGIAGEEKLIAAYLENPATLCGMIV